MAVAEALIGTSVDLLLSQLVSGIGENVRLISGFDKELGRLKDEVEMIQAVLRDAERRIAMNDEAEAVKLWLKRLEDFAYKAVDVLDEFAYEITRRKVKKVSNFMPSSSKPSLIYKLKMGKKIKEIFISLQIINKQASDYGLQRGGHVLTPPPPPPPHVLLDRETDSFVDLSDVVGREDDAYEIVETLVRQSNQETLSVLPIVGMGGIGKTTFAKLIYNDKQIKGCFNTRIWVCVSDDFDVKRILKEMLESLKKEKCNIDTMNAILEGLQKELGGEKYLLVLDDVWNEDHNKWNDFISRLRSVNTSYGSNILVTTRIAKVASVVGTFGRPFSLKGLSDDKCWLIFSARAFANGGVAQSGDFEAIGRKIVKKCGGLPLAAKVAGSMMYAKKDKNEWLSIANSRVWDSNGDESGVLPILKLSFDNLPSPSVKQCFAYCSIFAKDKVMKKNELIQLWMALGYVQQNEEDYMELEDIANQYFNILVQSSLFQDIKTDFYGIVVSCKMHDMVHDLSRFISKHQILPVEANTRLARDNIPDVRHMAIYSGGDKLHTIQKRADKLHTLILPRVKFDQGLVGFKRLRVLQLHECDVRILSTSIIELIHLKYLDLSRTKITVWSDFTINLYHLETLILGSINYLPKEMRNLISLRHLCFDGDYLYEMPLKMGRLTCLQTLPVFIVGKEKGRRIEELGTLEKLGGELEIRSLEKVKTKEDAERANLSRKAKIDKLKFEWSREREGSSYNDEYVLEGLQPHRNVKALEIRGFAGDNFPRWMMNGENLVDVKLGSCNSVEEIPMFGQLPLLRRLHLRSLKRVKSIGEQVESFPKLKEIVFENLNGLEEWTGESFPCLEKLTILLCRKLKTAPTHFPSLKELQITGVDSGLPILNICSKRPTNLTHLALKSISQLISLPDYLLHNNKHCLMTLEITDCPNLESVPSLQGLTSLSNLDITGCPKLPSLPSGLSSLARLQKLRIGAGRRNLHQRYSDMDCFVGIEQLRYSLRFLSLFGRPEWDILPEQIQYLDVLGHLELWHFGVEILPDWVGCVEELELHNMEKLKYLPSTEEFGKLRRLRVYNCPLLKARCKDGDCPELYKISTIPHVYFR